MRMKNLKGIRKSRTCPTCGHTSPRKVDQCRRCRTPRKHIVITDKLRHELKARFPHEGPDKLAKELGTTRAQVQELAYSIGVRLSKEAYRKAVHEASSRAMIERHKTSKLWMCLIKARAKREHASPNPLEQELFSILKQLQVPFEHHVVVDRYICDVLIDTLDVEIDGDWWHGHPRYAPLTSRQQELKEFGIQRDAALTSMGYTVVRIWESDLSLNLVENILVEYDILDF